MATLQDLPARWRSRAEELRPYAPPAAEAFDAAAAELEASLRDSLLEPLTLEQAEVESGYSRAHLRRMLREERVPNAGTEADPRILRRDLPRKPGYRVLVANARPDPASSRTQVVRAVAAKGA